MVPTDGPLSALQYLECMNYTGCRALAEDECKRILEAMGGRYWARDRAIFELMRRTGYRVSEVLSLRVGDVFDHECGTIRSSITVEKLNMKGRRQSRTMPLHAEARAALLLHIRQSDLDYTGFATWPLFCRQGTATPMSRRHALRILQDAAEAAGVDTDRLGTHSLRKTFASTVYQSPHVAGDLAKMSRLMGHANPSNTLRYLEFLDNSLEAAVLST